jgi:hypothetical protein
VSHDTLIAALIFAILAFGIVRTLQRWNREKNDFELRDLFMENGRASKGAVIMLGAFAATTWFFVYYALTGRMTEGYFGLYSAAWIIPVVARMIAGAPPEQREPA